MKSLLKALLGCLVAASLFMWLRLNTEAVETPKFYGPEYTGVEDLYYDNIHANDYVAPGTVIKSPSISYQTEVYVDGIKVADIISTTTYTTNSILLCTQIIDNHPDHEIHFSTVTNPSWLEGSEWIRNSTDKFVITNGYMAVEVAGVTTVNLYYIFENNTFKAYKCANGSSSCALDFNGYAFVWHNGPVDELFINPALAGGGDYIDPLAEDIIETVALADDAPATVEWNQGDSLPLGIMKQLSDNPNISLLFSFTYEGIDHQVMIPAGKAVADPDIEWYGPLWLLAKYGEYTPVNEYTVMPGDTLNKIAEKFETTVEKILALNPNIKNKNKIRVGQIIKY